MNKLEYIESLIAEGANSTEVFEKARQYDIDNPVKTYDTQNQDATAVSTNANASNTGSQSGDGSSGSQPTINPGQVLSRDDGFEYKYEIDPNDPNQGIYYSRQAGSEDEWANANEDTSERGNVAKMSIANLFGHSSFGEKEQKQYFDNLEKLEELKKAKKEATKQYQRDNELGVFGILTEGFKGETDDWFDWDGVRIFEGAARAIGETSEFLLDATDATFSKGVFEPIAGALNYAGLMDLSDYEDESWDGINFDGVINNIITDYAINEGPKVLNKNTEGGVSDVKAGAYGDKFDFSEEVGDRIEAGMLDIASGMMAMPKLIADTKSMINQGLEDAGLPQGAIDALGMISMFTGGALFSDSILSNSDLVAAGESAYEKFSKKSNQLNMTLMDFGEVGMTETLGKAFDGEATMEQRLGAFLTGGARITSSALGSLPSVAQSMIPYVGIASIVAGEAAKTNMESSKDGRPLDWGRLSHAYVIGASEGLLELVTKKIGKGMFQGLRGGGKEVIQKSLLQYGTKVMKEFGQEGLSEVGTLLINQAADYVYKDEVDNFFPAWGEVIDTFMIGGVMGGGMSSVGVGGQLLNSTIQSRNIKNNMKISGDTSLTNMFDSINPLSEGGLSQEIARGAEDSTVARERGPDGKPPTDGGGSGNPLINDKNVKPENIDAEQKNEGVSETSFVDSKGNKESKTSNPLTSRQNIDENNTANTPGKPTSKPKSTYTADERADAQYSVLTNPQTEMFLNTELKRKVASGEITTTKAEEIKNNFKQKQGAANKIADLGYSGESRQKIIDLIPERNRLAQKVKDVGESSLTKPEQDRIAEIDAEIGSIPRTDAQQAKTVADVEADIAFTEKFGNIGKKDGEFKNFIGENKAVVTYNTTKEFMEATGATDGNVDAFITPEGQIIINKQHMIEAGAIGVGRHELLHKILKSQFNGPNGEKLKNDFLKILEQTDPAGYKLLMSRIKQKDANGERIYDDPYLEDNPDEYLTIYASLLAEGQIPLEAFVEKPSLVKRLGNFFSNIFSDAANENPVGPNVKPTNVGFKDGKDLYDFVRGYIKDSKSGVLSNRATELAEQGKDIKGTKAQSKTVSKDSKDLFQKIKELVPSDVKTQQDFFNPRVFNNIFSINPNTNKGELNPLIKAYIITKSTSPEQATLNLKNVADRLINFDPAKKRADGKIVGPEGFAEFITSNTNFGKKDSNKELFKKGEKAKQQKSIDSGTLQIVEDTAPTKKDDTKLAKKPTETTKFNEDYLSEDFKKSNDISKESIENKITETIIEGYKDRDVTGFRDAGSPKFPIPRSVAQFYADMFGIKTVEGLTKKSQNFYPRDRDGLRNLQKFLIENALSDFNRLPKTVSDTGKSTGILSTKLGKVMYNDNGNLVGTVKQYRDIIQGKPITLTIQNGKNKGESINFNPPTKDISRGDLQQNLKTALDFHIKNRALEIKIPKQGKRLQSGAKFSKTLTDTQNTQLLKIAQLSGVDSVTNYLRDKGLLKGDITATDSNRKARQDSVLQSIKKGNIPAAAINLLGLGNFGAKRIEGKNGDYYYTLDNGKTIIGTPTLDKDGKQRYGKKRKNGTRPKLYTLPSLESIEAAYPGQNVKIQAAKGSLYYGKSDPAYKEMMKVADANNSLYSSKVIDNFKNVERIRIKRNTKLTRKQKKANKVQEDINQKALADFVKILDQRDGVEFVDGKRNPNYGKLIIPLNDSALFISQAYQGTTSLIKISAPFVGVSDVFVKAPKGTKQADRDIDYIEEHSPPASKVGLSIIYGLATNTVTPIMKGVKDNFIQIQLSNSSDVILDLAKLTKTLADGTSIVTPNAGFLRLAAAVSPNGERINLNTIQDLNTGLDIATTMGYPLKGKFKTDPSSVNIQNKLMLEQATNPDIKFSKSVSRLNAYVESIGESVIQASKKNSTIFGDKVNTNMSMESQVKTLSNYDKTLKFSRSLNTKPKGISVFDFDDTLAKTNSKVIVTMPESVQSITNTGDAKKVINTVYKSVINSVANNSNINTISFSSEFNEQSRVKLYNSLANKLSKELGWELDVFETVDSTGNTDVVTSEDFTLTKGKDAKKIKSDKNAIKFKKDVADNLKSSFDINGKTYDVSLDFRGKGDYSLEFSLRGKSKGKTYKINATEFAEQSADLEAQGAEFNFDEFSKVIDGKKGPLADLALKRQDKFGSGDIFVLTARPQAAAQGIKTFLDGIGLNLPLKNITGLENGTPEAKANWIISKTAEGYNDFYFADDAIGNVKAVKDILDQVDVKSKVQQAKYSKSVTFDKIMNDILEGSTGIKSEAEYSKARAQTVGAKKGRFTFFTTPSAEDFVGLIYKFIGKGKVGDAQLKFFQDNLIDPYNRAEQAVTRAKISAANDFKALKKSLKTLPKSLSKQTGIGGFTFGQAARVAVWTRQGMEVPGLSKRDAKEINAFVDNNAELDVFVDELINIQKGKQYPKPGQNWLAGNITSDIVNEINKVNRKEYMQEFNENLDIIFSDKVMNKLEAAYGPRYVEALRDMLRRMKSGSNRPVGNSRIVDGLLNWLNNSVGAIMFLNTRTAVLQTISSVNFINFGNNNIIAAGKAFANQKQYWKDFMTLMNSPYLVERRDGLKINVSESEIADAVSESSNKPKAFLNLLLSKGFVLTRIADSFAIAAGGSTFYRNQIKAYMKSGMDQKAAETQAFDDFYAIAETNQQSSNPSKISQQQASGAGRVILAFANTPMQYNRIIKRATQDLINGRGDWKTNVSKIIYYGAMQNLIFNALQTALFALAFGEEDEEKEDKTGRIANGMADSLLRGLGIQGAAVVAIKDALITIYEQANKEKGAPEFRKAIADLFGFSPPLDSKIRKLNSGANTLSWEREKMKQEGFNLNNPAYLAYAQVIAGLTNIPLDRAIQKINNLRAATSDSSAKWQKVALLMGWSTWDLGLPYYGVEDKEVQTPQTILRDKVNKMKKETSGKEQKQMLLDLGLTKQEIVKLKYEEVRIKKIIELQNKKK